MVRFTEWIRILAAGAVICCAQEVSAQAPDETTTADFCSLDGASAQGPIEGPFGADPKGTFLAYIVGHLEGAHGDVASTLFPSKSETFLVCARKANAFFLREACDSQQIEEIRSELIATSSDFAKRALKPYPEQALQISPDIVSAAFFLAISGDSMKSSPLVPELAKASFSARQIKAMYASHYWLIFGGDYIPSTCGQ